MHNPASRFLADLPGDLVDWQRTEADQVRWAPTSRRPRRAGSGSAAAAAREVPELAVGDRVNHDAFGLGTVVASSGYGVKAEVTVDFGSSGLKTLVLVYAPLTKL